ncbi:MAG: SIR2 family NAD-dependent protein deacylase [Flavobacteriales bacterium]
MSKQHLVVLTGAGISAESGIPTFRGSDGLWEGHDIYQVSSPDGWAADPKLVLDFYNMRREKVLEVAPNPGHHILAELEAHYQVDIITQNIDDLHERAGSTRIMHLHGEIRKARSTANPALVQDIDGPHLNWGELCPAGSQLRPHIVWFGEAVPLIEPAAALVASADVFVVVGTSLNVYPAAGLVQVARPEIPKYIIDPAVPEVTGVRNLTAIEDVGSRGLAQLRELLLT